MAWLGTVSRAQATGALAEAYAAMDNRPMPPVYLPPHGDAAGIIRAHSLDPELLRRTFSVSGALATTRLPWADRELLASATSRTNQCFYWTSAHAEFLRVASGDAAAALAVLQGDDESLSPRDRALVRLAVTLTAEPWALTREAVEDAARPGLDDEQIEAAVGVISMFNYFTRVADATGIEFDYLTPLPAFEPDLRQVTAPRPDRFPSPGRPAGGRRRPRHPQLQAVWESWRAYVLEADQPINRRERRLLASVAAEEAADWEGAEALSGSGASADGDGLLVRFARKLSRQPWRMEAGDLESLRSSGYSEKAVLHVISVVAHQNADSRLITGLSSASWT